MEIQPAKIRMNIADWVQIILAAFESRTEPYNEVEISDALRRSADDHKDMSTEDFKGYYAEWAAFLFYGRPDKDNVWGTYFAPMFTATRNDGKELRSPDIEDLDAETAAHWELRAQSVRDPVMRARYADLVWDLKRLITKQRPSYEYAQIAIDAYVEATQKKLCTSNIEGVQWLNRALDLSLSLNDKNRKTQVVDAMFEFYEKSVDPHHVGVWVFMFDTLYGKDLVNAEKEKRIIADLEKMLERTSSKGPNPDEFNPHGAQAAAERLAQHYKRQGDRANVERVITTYGGAFEQISKEASPMLAMAWLQPVIERYEQEGLKQDAERLQLLHREKGKNIASDLKEYSTTVEISKKEIDEIVEQLIGSGELKTSLLNIARAFIPKAKAGREFLETMRTQAPLLSIIPIGIVDRDGHTTARIGSLDEDLDGRLHRQLGEMMNFLHPFLTLTLERFWERYTPTVDQTLDFLCQSILFADARDGLLREGLLAYEREDFVKAIHVLVPQVEHILRNFLVLLDIPPLKTVRNHPGIMDAKSMNDVLGEPRVREVMTENLWRYLEVLYVDKKGGFNLRNDLAHGLLSPNWFNRAIADRIFHSLLALSLIRGKEKEPQG